MRGEERDDDPNYWWVLVMGRLRPGVDAAQVAGRARPDAQADGRGLEAGARGQGSAARARAAGRPRTVRAAATRCAIRCGRWRSSCRSCCWWRAPTWRTCCSRAAVRACRELSVRAAIGAPRARVVRQLFTEGALLAAFGAGLGVVVGAVDHRGAAAGAHAGAVRGDSRRRLAPAGVRDASWRAAARCSSRSRRRCARRRVTLTAGLQEASRRGTPGPRRGRLAGTLVVVQIALSMVLVVAAALLARSLRKLDRVELGFDPHNVLTFRLDPTLNGYDERRTRALYDARTRRAARIARRHGRHVHQPHAARELLVDWRRRHRVGSGSRTWFGGGSGIHEGPHGLAADHRSGLLRDAAPADRCAAARSTSATRPRHSAWRSSTASSPNSSSRPKTSSDAASVSACGAPRRSTRSWASRPTRATPRSATDMPPTVYLAAKQQPPGAGDVRGESRQRDGVHGDGARRGPTARRSASDRRRPDDGGPDGAVAQAGAALRAAGDAARPGHARALRDRALRPARRTAWRSESRRSDCAWRSAPSAPPCAGWCCAQSLAVAIVGLVAGAAAAAAGTRLIASMLYQLPPRDPVTLSVAAAVMLATCVLAGYLPARRASRVDPLIALRAE